MGSRSKVIVGSIFGILLIAGILYGVIWKWIVCRVYVPPGYVMYMTSKMGAENPDPETYRVVDEGTKGVQKRIYGEGRYFINPIIYNVEIEPMQPAEGYIGPLELGIVKSNSGETLGTKEFLVDPIAKEGIMQYPLRKGILRYPLTPGRWRLHPKAYDVEKTSATYIEPGTVGCLISRSGNPPSHGRRFARDGEQGVMERVLHPGIYYINPMAYKVIPVEVGYRQTLFLNLDFKSKDGFDITVDVSVVWGIVPGNVPKIMDLLGNFEDVKEKVIRPEVESCCRIAGSKYGAVQLVEGPSREEFQNNFTQKLKDFCKAKDIEVLLGLIRHIEIPKDIREPIQQQRISLEKEKTIKEETETRKISNELAKLKETVNQAVESVKADTSKVEATIIANGEKEVARIRAEQDVEVAKLKKEIADVEAQTARTLGEARAKAQELKRRAEADLLVQNIKAMGGAEAYTLYTFAQKISSDLNIFIRHAGQGTLWTDLPMELKNIEKVASLKIIEGTKQEK